MLFAPYVWSAAAWKLRRKSCAQPAGNLLWRRAGKICALLLARFASLPALPPWPSSPSAWESANTAIFSMVNSFLLRPLPVKNPEQITVLAMQLKKGELQTGFSYPEFEALQKQSSSVFSDVIAMSINAGGLTLNGKAEPIVVYNVSGNFFAALGVRPLLGRFILPEEGSVTALNPVIVLGYSFWQTRFGGDPGIVGKTVLYNGRSDLACRKARRPPILRN
jgi:hypothetical protein